MKKSALFLILVGLLATLPVSALNHKFSADWFPFAYYDATTGTSYGLAAVVKNTLAKDESMSILINLVGNGGQDLIFTSSFPDKEWRYRTLYPLALDLEIWNGKSIADRYYGLGSNSSPNNYTYYDNNYGELKTLFSRAVKNNVVLEGGLAYYSNQIGNITQGTTPLSAGQVDQTRSYYVGTLGLRMDDTDDYLNPHGGTNTHLNFDASSSFIRGKAEISKYITPFNSGQVLAGRLQLIEVAGNNLPVYEYATLGGRDTLRGYPTYRFRGGASALFNLEYRFPLFWSLGGVLFADSGKVADNLTNLDLTSWPGDYGFGLRMYLGSLILRLDYGIGQEENDFYFYYNQLF